MKKKLIAGLSALVLVGGGLGLGAVQLASADDTTPSPGPTAGPTTNPNCAGTGQGRQGAGPRGERGVHRAERGMGQHLSDLAEQLGVEESALREAMQQVRDSVERPEPLGPDATRAERDAARAEHRAVMAKALAEQLGLDEAEVTEALTEHHTEVGGPRGMNAQGPRGGGRR